MTTMSEVQLIDAWRVPAARTFVRNVWPMYVHELSGFDSDFYWLDSAGRWQPDIVEDWLSDVTPEANLRAIHLPAPAHPSQRTHVISNGDRPVGFVCIGVKPFKYMPEDVEFRLAELFLIHEARGRGVGARAVDLLFHRYSGSWQLEVIHDNLRAIAFWRRVLAASNVRTLAERQEGREVKFRFATAAVDRPAAAR